jgi:phage terminase large subunit-like protein
VRAEPYAAQVQGGNVLVVREPWTQDFIDEHVAFPVGRTKGQVDAAAAGFNLLTLERNAAIVVVPIRGFY